MQQRPTQSAVRQSLRVIEGGGASRPSWQQVPKLVLGRSPFDHSKIVRYRVATDDVQKGLDANRKQPLLDLWAAVVGELPPFPGVTRFKDQFARTATSLAKAHACFRGIKRPVGDDDHGFDVIAFVSKPTQIFAFEPSPSCSIKMRAVPSDLVLVTYVRLDYSNGRPYRGAASEPPPITGVVVSWEFVEADPDESDLPIGYTERYRQRLW